ncbi:MAG: hypothetical protein ACREM1_16205 [Longimicrobiales bacterium]
MIRMTRYSEPPDRTSRVLPESRGRSPRLAVLGEGTAASGGSRSMADLLAEDGGMRLVELEGEARELFSTLAVALAVLNEALLPDSESFPADLIALLLRPSRSLGQACRTAASALVRFVVEDRGSGAAGGAASSMESARLALLRATTEFMVDSGRRLSDFEHRVGDYVYGDAMELLREIGVEEQSRFVSLAFDRETGGPVLGINEASRSALDVYLLSRVFDRLEASLLVKPFLRMEREASAWHFARWSTEPRGAPDVSFTRGVREQEWSLAGREMMYLSRSAAAAYVEQKIAQDTPPRQLRLSRALAESSTSAFSVREKDGDRAVFEDRVTGRRYTVHEHNMETDYRPGMLGLGRIIPVDGVHLRSPGMALFASDDAMADETFARSLAEGLTEAGDATMRMVVTEGLISKVILRADVPRRVLPAPSIAAARERAAEVTDLLEAEGFASPVSPEDVPPEVSRRKHQFEEVRTMRYEMDEVMAEWLRALMEHGQRGQRRHGRAQPRRARARKAKKRRR